MAAFADSDDMIARYDERTLGDLCADDGTRVGTAELSTNTKMLAALESATGEIIAACLRAERYTRADLDGLTAESLDYLIDLTCRLAYWRLWSRRTWSDRYERIMKEAKQEAQEALELLRSGDHVFDVTDAKDAGTPSVETVKVNTANDWNLITDKLRGHLLPKRRTYRNR